MRIILVLFIAVIFYTEVKGDYCYPNFQRDTSTSEIIFIGKVDTVIENVLNTRIFRNQFRKDELITNFIIYKSFKGFEKTVSSVFENDTDYTNPNKEISYISILGSLSSSTIRFKKDSVYLVFAYYQEPKGILRTDDCTNTNLLSRCDSLLNKLPKPLMHKGGEDEYVKAILQEREKEKLKKLIETTAIKNTINKLERKTTLFAYTIGILSLLLLSMILFYFVKIRFK